LLRARARGAEAIESRISIANLRAPNGSAPHPRATAALKNMYTCLFNRYRYRVNPNASLAFFLANVLQVRHGATARHSFLFLAV
jgi:hypothetical protein